MGSTLSHKSRIRKIFDNNSQRYDEILEKGKFFRIFPIKWFVGPEEQFLEEYLEELEIDKSMEILELCVGTGRMTRILEEYFDIIYGVDISEKMLGIARNKLKKTKLICYDAENISNKRLGFDIVFCFASFNYFQKPSRILEEVRKILRKDGILVLTVPNKYHPLALIYNLWDKLPTKRYDKSQIRKLAIGNDFLIEKIELRRGIIFAVFKKKKK